MLLWIIMAHASRTDTISVVSATKLWVIRLSDQEMIALLSDDLSETSQNVDLYLSTYVSVAIDLMKPLL